MTELLTDLQAAAEWASTFFRANDYVLDFSPWSLNEVDRLFDEHTSSGNAKPDGLFAEDLGIRVWALGAYVGEVFRRNAGGSWHLSPSDPDSEIDVEFHTSTGYICWPIQRVMKRMRNGAEDAIAPYGMRAGVDTRPPQGTVSFPQPWWRRMW